MAQDRLPSQGSSLRAMGVRGAVLIAPVIPEPLPCDEAAENRRGVFLRQRSLIFYTGRNGGSRRAHRRLPTSFRAGGIRTSRSSRGSRSSAPRSRRSSTRAFAPETGTTAAVIALENDAFFTVSEERALYDYLSGDVEHEKLFYTIAGSDAVHNMHTFAPEAELHSIKKLLNAMECRGVTGQPSQPATSSMA